MFDKIQTPQNPEPNRQMPPIPQTPQNNQAVTPFDNSNNPRLKKILLGLVIFFVLIIISAGAYWWLKKDTDSLALVADNTNVVDNVSITDDSPPKKNEEKQDEIIKNEERTLGDIMGDYTTRTGLTMASICYFVKNPDARMLIPEELRDKHAPAIDLDDEESQKYFESSCSFYKEEAYAHVEKLLKTDEDNDGLNAFLEFIYTADDTMVDTDNDGYDDLQEVISGYNPNDLLVEEMKSKWDTIISMVETEGDFDMDKALDICKSFDEYHMTDTCLESISVRASDPSFCDTAGFSDFTFSKISCEDNFLFKSGNPEDCLETGGSGPYICLGQYVEKEKSLDPCLLVGEEDFNVCTGGNFSYLETTADCHKYKSLMTEYDFDDCVQAVAFSTKKPLFCDELEKESISYCVWRIAYDNADPSFCEYYAAGSGDYTYCVDRTPDGRDIDTEEKYLAFCNSYNGGSTMNQVDKRQCFTDLAIKFDEEKYCKNSAAAKAEEGTDGYKRLEDFCYQDIIYANERLDLCDLITNAQVLGNLNQKDYCLL